LGGPIRRGTKALLRDINNSRVFQIIQSTGPLSRADIARVAELPPPTVTRIVNDFLRADLIREVAEERENIPGLSGVGRPPILLSLNDRVALTAGVKLRRNALTVAVMDLAGNVLYHVEHQSTCTTPEDTLGVVAGKVAQAFEDSGQNRDRLLGIGIGMPGLIDHSKGVCRFSPFLGWERVEVRRMLEERCGVPVYLDNDVNLLTAAQIAFGAGRGVANFLVVTLGEGIGLGIVIGGEIYRGAFGGAGEFGHMKLGGRLRCECGAVGCLEATASEDGTCEQVAAIRGVPSISMDEAIELCADGDPAVGEVFARAGTMLGQGVGNVLNLFNPELVIVTGEGVRIGSVLLEPMKKAIGEASFAMLGRDPRFVFETLGDEAWAQGAASIVVQEMLRPPIYESGAPEPLAYLLDRSSETKGERLLRPLPRQSQISIIPEALRPEQPKVKTTSDKTDPRQSSIPSAAALTSAAKGENDD